MKTLPNWAVLSLAANGLLVLLVVQLWQGGKESLLPRSPVPVTIPASASTTSIQELQEVLISDLGPRHQLSYAQWVELLDKEAQVMAQSQPQHLNILLGDSISLWFPPDFLPPERIWLNQGISGETTYGLMRRIPLLDQTRPEAIFVMIGINDLLRGIKDRELLENQRKIIRDLRWNHPQASIVVHSILPHSGPSATWEGRNRLLAVSNDRIRNLNRQLKAIALEEGGHYLDLQPLFTDENGYLRRSLSTDGLHLNREGYLLWSSALLVFCQLELDNPNR